MHMFYAHKALQQWENHNSETVYPQQSIIFRGTKHINGKNETIRENLAILVLKSLFILVNKNAFFNLSFFSFQTVILFEKLHQPIQMVCTP